MSLKNLNQIWTQDELSGLAVVTADEIKKYLPEPVSFQHYYIRFTLEFGQLGKALWCAEFDFKPDPKAPLQTFGTSSFRSTPNQAAKLLVRETRKAVRVTLDMTHNSRKRNAK